MQPTLWRASARYGKGEGAVPYYGAAFREKPGWSYTIISPDDEFEQCFGRKADKRRKLYNGMIKCQVYLYFRNGSAGR